MGLRLFNTLSRSIQEFKPLKGNTVRLYSCGPTVYDYSHIGNFRSFLFIDLLKRYLLFSGYDVIHITNLTDVDDRIIKRCAGEGISLSELTQKYRDAFFKDIETLSVLPSTHYPAATDHILEMQEMIKILVEKGFAYSTEDGSVFFKISSFPEYGNLSRIDATRLSRTARMLNDQYEKEQIRDFALWKGWKEEDGDIYWDSPWGRGRPGWHVECSAMSMKFLGEEFDIHCGGIDLIFPHHENEIAQTVCATGKRFANLWLHCEHLLVDGAKMSKSLGNYYTLRDLVKEGVSSQTIRYFLITTNYRQKINLTFKHLETAAKSLERLQDFRRRLEVIVGEESQEGKDHHPAVIDQFCKAMDDDLNISEAMAAVFKWLRDVNRRLDAGQIFPEEAKDILVTVRKLDSVIGVIFNEEVYLSKRDRALIQERESARQVKDWKRADEIRKYFLKKRIRLEDTSHGTVVKYLSSSQFNPKSDIEV